MTHGDELPLDDRIQAQIFLGEMLGLSADHVFDISGEIINKQTMICDGRTNNVFSNSVVVLISRWPRRVHRAGCQ